MLFKSLFVCVACVLAVVPSAGAVELRVDFGVGDVPEFVSTSPNDVQAGFSDFSLDATEDGIGGTVDLALLEAGVTSRVFSGVTVGIEPISGEAGFFDGPDELGPLGDLTEDGLYRDAFVRLTDLPAGAYEMTTYHYMSDLIFIALAGNAIDIFLDTGTGESLVAAGITAELHELVTVPIPFTASGTQDVAFRFSGVDPWINGFALVEVPEPASWLLLGLGIGGLVGLRRYARCRCQARTGLICKRQGNCQARGA